MQKHINKNINRIIDANINRTKEGLRILEEIARFVLNNHKLTLELKKIRHNLDSVVKRLPAGVLRLLQARDSKNDVGKDIHAQELKRKNLKDIFFANIQRVKESTRVLEEFTKIYNTALPIAFKKIRYAIYEIEKKIAGRISSLYNHR